MKEKTKKPKFPIYSVINEFEGRNFLEPEKINAQMRSLYYFLLHISSQKGGITKFPIAIHFLQQGSKIGSLKTVYTCLERLEKLGILKYTKGKNRWTFPVIELLFCERTTTLLKEYWLAIRNSTNNPIVNFTNNNYYDNNEEKDENDLNDKKDTVSLTPRAQKKNIPFEVYWALYDKKVNQVETKKLWGGLNFKTQLEIVVYVAKYVQATPNKQYRKNPDNFLREEIWKNEIININKSIENNNVKQDNLEEQNYSKNEL